MTSRHIYFIYFTIRCFVQTSKFSETDCPVLSNRTLRVQQLFLVVERVIESSRIIHIVLIIVMQTCVEIRDLRYNVVALTLIVILAGLTRARTHKDCNIDCTRRRTWQLAVSTSRYRRVNICVTRKSITKYV